MACMLDENRLFLGLNLRFESSVNSYDGQAIKEKRRTMKRILYILSKTFVFSLKNYMWEILFYYFLFFFFVFGCMLNGFEFSAAGAAIIICFIVVFKLIKRAMLKIGDYTVRRYERRRREKLIQLYEYLKN